MFPVKEGKCTFLLQEVLYHLFLECLEIERESLNVRKFLFGI